MYQSVIIDLLYSKARPSERGYRGYIGSGPRGSDIREPEDR